MLRTASDVEKGKMPGRLGLHRPYLRDPTGGEEQLHVMREVRARLSRDLIPARLIDLMMSRPSNDVYWLSYEEIEELGLYPPQQEEFFITRCGYDRNYLDKLVATMRKSREQSARMEEGFTRTQQCIGSHQDDMRKEMLSRLRTGWVPPAAVR